MFETELEKILKDEGACLVGFCQTGDENLPYAVSIAYKLSDSVLSTITNAPTMMYFQHYRIVNTKLDLLSLSALSFIESKGYRAFPVAASQSIEGTKGYFSHKEAAVKAGLGYIGRNCLLITKEYGSKIRLATVLTDMPLSPQRERVEFSCGDCNLCVSACPAGAISGKQPSTNREDFFDATLCSTHMKKAYQHIGRGSVCGICIKVCPKNK